MDADVPSSDEIALNYLEQLPWEPYPFQEQAILSWFEGEDGILVCAPTGTGKTVIAETALYEALVTGKKAYYTTPLIALTEQKFDELQDSAERWGYSRDDVGLVTGNRHVNPDARILVVVAEILLNRLLTPDEFPFDDVSAVVMDEFHSFNDPERGIVWELTLGMLPIATRVLLISATVGNAPEFVSWLSQQHRRRLRLLQSEERRVPLDFRWVPISCCRNNWKSWPTETRKHVTRRGWCFVSIERNAGAWPNSLRENGCWLMVNKNSSWQNSISTIGRSALAESSSRSCCEVWEYIMRAFCLGTGRVVEALFQKKLLSICVCTETLAAGINLPARSVVMVSLLKGPHGKQKVVEASAAHQMFGRAGRPQFDSRGYVFAVAHEDDVKIFRWKEKYDAIPEDTKDPLVLKAKKKLKKKMPKRRDGQQYWSEKQFETLRHAPSGKLASKGRFPWRLLAFLIRKSGNVRDLQAAVHRRLLDSDEKENALKRLKQMLLTLESGGFIALKPPPPGDDEPIHFNVIASPECDFIHIRQPQRGRFNLVVKGTTG